MRTNLIQIGNSKGIRIPKTILHECGFDEVKELEIVVKNHQIILKRSNDPREGWAKAFQKMTENGDDQLLDQEYSSHWDNEEWIW